MICRSLLCWMSDVLQCDYSFDVFQGYAHVWARWFMLSCDCTCTLKNCRSQKTPYTSYMGELHLWIVIWLDQVKYVLHSCLFPVVRWCNIFSFQLKTKDEKRKNVLLFWSKKSQEKIKFYCLWAEKCNYSNVRRIAACLCLPVALAWRFSLIVLIVVTRPRVIDGLHFLCNSAYLGVCFFPRGWNVEVCHYTNWGLRGGLWKTYRSLHHQADIA